MTVLVGKNNEGKSNILRALSLAMSTMRDYASDPGIRRTTTEMRRRFSERLYNWERDFPFSLQNSKKKASEIDLVFELTKDEIRDIHNSTKIWLNSELPIRITFSKDESKVEIPKKGTPATANSTNVQNIMTYVCKKIDFNFIPAVRTGQDTVNILEPIIERALFDAEKDIKYREALETLEKLQQEKLNDISQRIVAPLQAFLPSVKSLQIRIPNVRRRSLYARDIDIIIDDGVPTSIESKGDGIKSLTALALLNNSNNPDKMSVIAIEEPEAHLHPEAARQLYQTILSLSEKYQVVLTTHSPLFINRSTLQDNIIVDKGKAAPVKRIKEIREALGTIISDNLINAENILLVEGEDDKIILDKLLPNMNEKIKKSIQNSNFIIDYVGGAGNFPYKLTLYRNIQCNCCVFLDDDDAGRTAGAQLEKQGLSSSNILYAICNGSTNSEIEDCLEKNSYKEIVLNDFGVSIDVSEFRGNDKWSERMRACFCSQGKQWNEDIEKRVKKAIAENIATDPNSALNSHKRSSIDALASQIERMLN